MWRDSKRVAIYKLMREASEETKPADISILNVLAPKLWKSYISVAFSLCNTVYGVLWRQAEQTNIPTHGLLGPVGLAWPSGAGANTTQAETGKVSLAALEILASNPVNHSGLICWMVRSIWPVFSSPQLASQPKKQLPRWPAAVCECRRTQLSSETNSLARPNCWPTGNC